MLPKLPLTLLPVLLCALPATAETAQRSHAATVPPTAAEVRAIRSFAHARENPLYLRAFLVRMPKGSDLHMHLGGAVYAETFLADARADLLCIDPHTLSLAKNIGTTRSIPPQPVCGEGRVSAASAFGSTPDAQHLYSSLVDSFSMRSFVPSSGTSAHDQFFATFGRFSGLKSHTGEWLDEVATRAAAQNELYLEVMVTPTFRKCFVLG